MKSFLLMYSLSFLLLLSFSYSFAQEAVPVPAQPVQMQAPAVTSAPALQSPSDISIVPEIVKTVTKQLIAIPFIGPIVAKVLLWIGVIASILTALCAFLLSAIVSLSTVLTWTGLAEASAFIVTFQNGKIMYWLKYFSMFNAKDKPVA